MGRDRSTEAIGPLGAGPDARGVFRVGGDLLVSRDALARLEAARASRLRRRARLARRRDARGARRRARRGPVADERARRHRARTLTSVRDVIARRRAPRSSRP